MQGRVACEVNSGDELAATELIFGGVLTQLTPEEAVAVLSSLVFQVTCFSALALSGLAFLLAFATCFCAVRRCLSGAVLLCFGSLLPCAFPTCCCPVSPCLSRAMLHCFGPLLPCIFPRSPDLPCTVALGSLTSM